MFMTRAKAGIAPPLLSKTEVQRAAAAATAAAPAPDTVVVAWNEIALEAIRHTHPGPPMVAWILSVLHTSMYDAWAAYSDVAVATRTKGYLRRPTADRTQANKVRAVSYAGNRFVPNATLNRF